MIEYTTPFDMTLEVATAVANRWSNAQLRDGTVKVEWRKEYNTAIPGIPIYTDEPTMCWAVTNKFDPRVAKGE